MEYHHPVSISILEALEVEKSSPNGLPESVKNAVVDLRQAPWIDKIPERILSDVDALPKRSIKDAAELSVAPNSVTDELKTTIQNAIAHDAFDYLNNGGHFTKPLWGPGEWPEQAPSPYNRPASGVKQNARKPTQQH